MVQENEVSGIDLKIKNNDPKPNGSKKVRERNIVHKA